MTKSGKDSVPGPPPLTREEVARWLADRGDLLLREVRFRVREARVQGLGGPHTAFLLDEEDICSSIVRRMDEAVVSGRICTGESAVLWLYVRGMMRRVVQHRLRRGAQDVRLYSRLTAEERGLLETAMAELDAIAPIVQRALSPQEWDEVAMRARRAQPVARATDPAAGPSPVERKRWSRLLAVVRQIVADPPPPHHPPPTTHHHRRAGVRSAREGQLLIPVDW